MLVVAPHPDDESLCCGGLIHAARSAGARVAIVWITNGDGFKWDAIVVEKKIRPRAGAYLELARQREGEARGARADCSACEPDSLMFLGYPDRGVLRLLFDYYHPDTPWRSKFTGANAVVYEDAVDPGAPYRGENLVKDFNSVLDRVKPTLGARAEPAGHASRSSRHRPSRVANDDGARRAGSRALLDRARRARMAGAARLSPRLRSDRRAARARHAMGNVLARQRSDPGETARGVGAPVANESDATGDAELRAIQ